MTPNRQAKSPFDSDLMHERVCARYRTRGCATKFWCCCGKMSNHDFDSDLDLCGICYAKKHPAPQGYHGNDPDDLVDLGGYRHRYYRS